MPIKRDELSAHARGGTELMKRALEAGLAAAGRADLLEAVDIYPSRVRDFDPSRPSVYWMHDLPGDTEARHLAEDGGRRFDALVFVSHWQHQAFAAHFKLDHPRTAVLRNAIAPFAPETWRRKLEGDPPGSAERPVRLIYHTTPHRGLALLVPAFAALHARLRAEGVHIVLDVYSSFALYGRPQADTQFEGAFQACREHPAIAFHGAVDNAEVREALSTAHIFAYPSIWPETSCIALIEAMAAGCIGVHTNLGALPETAGGYSIVTPFLRDREVLAANFAEQLEKTVRQLHAGQGGLGELAGQGAARAARLYAWETRVAEWIALLEAVKRGHPSHVSG